ncbi:YcaO-like family protein [Fervidibacillus albus]|uniref:YcaO-like family protein n=1 Tax=Fervidibacillus albus TaxID=2980026 RepID=A0A9E8RVN4_9BACI|nr:YcaO-like family protein [Fervidibacillus albus]WAA09138.1 YcaO-like family protein [Fervidibacillus albus]
MRTLLTKEFIDLRVQHFKGKVFGLWRKPEFYHRIGSYPLPKFKFITSSFPRFEKMVYQTDHIHFTFHLSGYGMLQNETQMAFLGESAERFAYASQYSILKNQIIFDSYNNLMEKKKDHELVCSLDYINIHYDKNHNQYIKGSDKISWLKIHSLIKKDCYVYIPFQMIVSGASKMLPSEKHPIMNAVSTGTASHETFTQSLENAIIEYMQLDSFNIHWYGGVKGKDITDSSKDIIDNVFGKDSDFFERFTIKFTDISFDKPIFVVMCEIFSDDNHLPRYTVGIQGAYTLHKAIYRSLMETLAILEYNLNICWTDPERFKNVVSLTTFDNLDDNVIYYSRVGKPKLKYIPYSFQPVNKVNNLQDLLRSLIEYSTYAGWINITPVDFVGCNQVVTRVVIPEFLPLCIPSFPQSRHPKYLHLSGVVNDDPHPLP